jgi:hypothetical protein
MNPKSSTSQSQDARESLEQRLQPYPELKAKIETLLSIVENEGDAKTADAAEQQVIEEIQKLGQSALQAWANQQNQQQTVAFVAAQPQAQRARKKTSTGRRGLV